ncbi:TGO1 protein, partial [Atractosteus spatula]|nr:TGO1 protein [Atractosteus spatula]
MCRGKAAQDFFGPDCRFLTFKKGETIYVYYKLSGKRNDLWAGSVGSRFGYFPKDLLEINHIYSVKEIEIPAEETDFVCFDGQLDTFDSYDVDQLLGSSVLLTENDTSGQETAAAEKENQGSNAQNQVDKQEDDVPSQISPEESDDTEKTTDDEIHMLHDNGVETMKDDLDQDENMVAAHEVTAEDNTTKDKSPSLGEDKLLAKDDVPEKKDKIDVSEVQPASNLKTTIGSTFDAVTTDDENTQKVTPFYDDFENEEELLDTEQDEPSEASEVTPLLSYSEDNVEDTSEQEGVSDSPESEDRLGYKAEEMNHGKLGEVLREDPTKEEMKEDKSMWTSLGDTVFAIVSGADRTNQVTSLEDEDEEDDFELDVAEKNEDPKIDTIPLLGSDVQVDHGELPHSSAKETVSDEIIQEIPDDKVTDESLSVQKTKEREGSEDSYKLNQDLDVVVNQNGHASKWPSESDQERKLEYENMPETPGRRHDNLKATLVSEVQDSPIEHKSVTEELVHTDVREASVSTPGRRPIEEDEESTNTEEKHAPSPEHLTVNDNDNLGQQEKKTLKLSEEKEHGDSITEITLLKGYFDEKRMERISKFLSPQHILRVEAMFNDLDQELKKARQTFETIEDIEKALDSTLESSETRILDEIERMLDARELKFLQMDGNMLDEEAAILDDFQELAFQLRQKYSTVSDSTPLMSRSSLSKDPASEAQKEKLDVSDVLAEIDMLTKNHTSTGDEFELQEKPLNQQEDNERPLSERRHSKTRSDIGVEEDGGHFNRNKDSHFMEDVEEIQKGPQTTLENTLDIGLGIDVEHSSSGFLESPKTPDYSEDEKEVESQSVLSLPSIAEIGNFFTLAREYLGTYTEILVGTLPEEWQPGPTFYGLPWQPVIATAMVGLLSFLIFFWRTLLAVKSRTYLLTEKQLVEKIKQLIDEKSEALSKISELNKLIEEREQQLKVSEKSKSSAKRENKDLQVRLYGNMFMCRFKYINLDTFKELQRTNELMKEKVKTLNRSVEEERKKNHQQEEIITETQKSVDKFQSIIKSNRTELSKVQALVEEAKLREEALKAELQSFEKENNILKSKKKALLKDAKDWEEKHRELSEQIKVFQKSQKELEDTVVHKENEIEVLSNCIAELQQLEADAKYESADLQKGDAMILANGEALVSKTFFPLMLSDQKNDTIKNRIKQMMDVSRVKTTLTIVQEERDHYFTKLLAEEKERHELEEQIKKLEHDQATMLSEKCHLESQFKTTQQKLEIMNEMYQQKENALQQKLTQEEFERREKEQKLSEVGGKALQAEEELKTCKQRIQEIEEELQKTERSYKNQIASHEKKAHENWLNARSAERALVEEKRETANLRQKLIEVNEKLAELQRPSLIKPTPGRPDRQLPPFRKGDSFGPSPVSGGAPSPPPMFDGPGRPPSAPLGRREPFGPVDSQLGPRRPPSETLGRFSDLGHPPPSRPDAAVSAPRTSSPSVLDGSVIDRPYGLLSFVTCFFPFLNSALKQNPPVETQALSSSLPIPEALEAMNSKSQGPPSFPGTPIMNSPASGATPPAKGFAPPLVAGPFPPPLNGPTPPPLLGPLNGHPSMPPAVPPLAPGPRYGPPHPSKGPYGPRPYGAVPPPNVRGPVPPHRDYPPGPPPPFGPRDLPAGFRDHHSAPPLPHGHRDYPFSAKNLPPGGIPPPGVRDYPGPPPPAHLGPRDFPAGPPPVPNMAPRDYPAGPGGPAQQAAPRDTSSTLQNEP